MKIRLTKNFALFASKRHRFGAGVVKHGPQSWPWWRLFGAAVYRANPEITFAEAPVRHWLVWLYTRWFAVSWHIGIDYRTAAQRGLA